MLWDKNCFTGTDYCFILPLQTLANITLHTNVQHQPERVKKRGWVGSERRGGGVGGGQVMAWPAYFDMSRPAKRINIITFCYYCALNASCINQICLKIPSSSKTLTGNSESVRLLCSERIANSNLGGNGSNDIHLV